MYEFIKIALITSVFFLCFSNHLFAQDSYIATYERRKGGVEILKGLPSDNAKFIQVKENGKIVKYTPYDLLEYGLDNGQKFISKEIDLGNGVVQVFLEELFNTNNTKLYYYHSVKKIAFFVEKDHFDWIIVTKGNFKETLASFTEDCEYSSKAIKIIDFKKSAMKRFIQSYHNCENVAVNKTKWGASLRMGGTNLDKPKTIVNDIVNTIDFNKTPLFNLGFFFDRPLEGSNFSFNSGLYFSSYRTDQNITPFDSTQQVKIKVVTLEVPIMARYYIPTKKVRPYLNIGAMANYNIVNDSRTFPGYNYLSNFLLGYVWGVGIQFNSEKNNTISFELRNNKVFGSPKRMIKRQTEFLFSVTF